MCRAAPGSSLHCLGSRTPDNHVCATNRPRTLEIADKVVQPAAYFVSGEERVAQAWRGAIIEDSTRHVDIRAIRKSLGTNRIFVRGAIGIGYQLIGRWRRRGSTTSSRSLRPF